MALAGSRLDFGSRRAACATRYYPHASRISAVLGHSHCVHTDWFGMYHVVGGDRRQPVRQQRVTGDRRTATRDRFAPMDRSHRSHAPVFRYSLICHGGYWNREYNRLTVYGNGVRGIKLIEIDIFGPYH